MAVYNWAMDRPSTAPDPRARRAPSAPDPRTNRSRVTNGAAFPRGVDGRSAAARRWKDLYRSYRSALPGSPTAAQDAFLRALASAGLALETVAAQQAQGAAVDTERLVALARLQDRLMERLGIAPAPPEPERPIPITDPRFFDQPGIPRGRDD